MEDLELLENLNAHLFVANPGEVYQHMVWWVKYRDESRRWRGLTQIGEVVEYVKTIEEGKLKETMPAMTCQFNSMDIFADDDEMSEEDVANILFKFLEEFDAVATNPFIAFSIDLDSLLPMSDNHYYQLDDLKSYLERCDFSKLKRKGFKVEIVECENDAEAVYDMIIIYNV